MQFDLTLTSQPDGHTITVTTANPESETAFDRMRDAALAQAEAHIRREREWFFSLGEGKELRAVEQQLELSRGESKDAAEELAELKLELSQAVGQNNRAEIHRLEAAMQTASAVLDQLRARVGMLRAEASRLKAATEGKLKAHLAAARVEHKRDSEMRRIASLSALEANLNASLVAALEADYVVAGDALLDKDVAKRTEFGGIAGTLKLWRVLTSPNPLPEPRAKGDDRPGLVEMVKPVLAKMDKGDDKPDSIAYNMPRPLVPPVHREPLTNGVGTTHEV